MDKVISEKTLIVTLIIVLLSATGYVVNDKIVGGEEFSPSQIQSMIDEGNWYYCELENSLKQCNNLVRYGIDNAKCVKLDGTGDICTKDGNRMEWKPFSEYIGVKLSDPYVEALQLEEIHYYNESVKIYVNCTKWKYNLSDCTKYILNKTGKVCVNWSKSYYESTCFNGTKIVLKNYTTFKSLGFNVTYKDKTYAIRGGCCGFYNESPYKQFKGLPVISCKEIVGGVCNSLIQQTSKDFTVFDEYGMIYVIHKTFLEPKRVGGYGFVDDYVVEPSKLSVEKFSTFGVVK